ncbi:hypothetical protein HDU85_003061 [Gaertneriomyces sp. JEL0708]|nr:hypothetical protein HDU85_003061 [Gaertneriomyces sp. JEL0708]
MVGEIGIDGVASDRLTKEKYSLPHQVDMFKRQLDLAANLRRTVNVHTVQCHGKLLEIVREYDSKVPSGKDRRKAKANSRHSSTGTDATAACEQPQPDPFPPKFINHSYSGSVDIILQLVRLPRIGRRFYFSFSSAINSRSPKTLSRIRCVPDNRILIESDLHDPAGMDAQIWKSCELVAEAKGWSMMECAQKVAKNVRELLNHNSTQH